MMMLIEKICGLFSADPDDAAMILTMCACAGVVILPILFVGFIVLALYFG